MVTKRKHGLGNPALILSDMKTCRDAMIEIQKAYDHKTAIHREANVLMRSLDDLGLLITGKRDLFLSPRHSTSPRQDG